MKQLASLDGLDGRAIADAPALIGHGAKPQFCARCDRAQFLLWFDMTPLQTLVGVALGFALALGLGLTFGVVRI